MIEDTPKGFEKQVSLAETLSNAVNARNDFIEMMGGFDDFAGVHQHVSGNRERYDKLEEAISLARKDLEPIHSLFGCFKKPYFTSQN